MPPVDRQKSSVAAQLGSELLVVGVGSEDVRESGSALASSQGDVLLPVASTAAAKAEQARKRGQPGKIEGEEDEGQG